MGITEPYQLTSLLRKRCVRPSVPKSYGLPLKNEWSKHSKFPSAVIQLGKLLKDPFIPIYSYVAFN